MESLLWLAIFIVICAGWWKMFTKAGEPGWAAIIPFYNLWVLNRIGGKPGWWFILYFVPLVNLLMIILLYMGVAKKFGEGFIYALGLFFLPIIFFPILGFGRAQYHAEA